MVKHWKLALVVCLLAVIGLFWWFDAGRWFSLDNFQASRERLQLLVDSHRPQAGLVYLLLYVCVLALALPVAAIMTLAGGALFGLGWGIVLASFGASLGCLLSFLLARTVLRDWVQRRFRDRLLAVNRGMEREGGQYLFALRLVPVFPPTVINLLMGLTSISARRFYWISQLGMLPATAVYVNAGTQLGSVTSPGDVFTGPVVLSFTLLGIFPLLVGKALGWYRRRQRLARFRRPVRYDTNLVVLGGGSAGLVAALIAAGARANVTLVERDRMGGDCLNTGCIPSKALIRSAAAMHAVRSAARFGVDAEGSVDFAQVMARVQEVIRTIEPHDSVERFTGLGVECISGHARIVSPWEVDVAGRRISAPRIVIASGARPLVPPLPGLDAVPWSNSDTIWSLDTLPARLLVLGAGPIGCELAQAFARLGSMVTLVDMADRLLPREDEDVSTLLREIFSREGITVLTGYRVERFEADADGWRMLASHGGDAVTVTFDHVLLALGRKPNVDDLGLADVGVELAADGTVAVDPWLRTSVPTIYACGDVVGPFQFTHMASHQAWYAAVNALFDPLKKFRVDYSVVPWCTFTDPEVARVGLSEVEAAERGVAVEVVTYPLAGHDRAVTDGATEGFVKVLVARGSDRILGATIVGAHAGELIGEFVLAMKHRLGLNKLLGTIHTYPTMLEANKFAAGTWRRSHLPQRLLAWGQRFHAWRRG